MACMDALTDSSQPTCWRSAVTGIRLNTNRSVSFYSKGSSTMMQISNLFITQEDIIAAGWFRYALIINCCTL